MTLRRVLCFFLGHDVSGDFLSTALRLAGAPVSVRMRCRRCLLEWTSGPVRYEGGEP